MEDQRDLAQRAEQRIGIGDQFMAAEEEGQRGERQVHAVAVAADVARDLPVAVEEPVGVGDVGHLVRSEESRVEEQPDAQGGAEQGGKHEPVGPCAGLWAGMGELHRAVAGSWVHRRPMACVGRIVCLVVMKEGDRGRLPSLRPARRRGRDTHDEYRGARPLRQGLFLVPRVAASGCRQHWPARTIFDLQHNLPCRVPPSGISAVRGRRQERAQPPVPWRPHGDDQGRARRER